MKKPRAGSRRNARRRSSSPSSRLKSGCIGCCSRRRPMEPKHHKLMLAASTPSPETRPSDADAPPGVHAAPSADSASPHVGPTTGTVAADDSANAAWSATASGPPFHATSTDTRLRPHIGLCSSATTPTSESLLSTQHAVPRNRFHKLSTRPPSIQCGARRLINV